MRAQTPSSLAPGGTPAAEAERLDRATAGLEPPFALVDLDAFDANAAHLLARAGGKPVRLATKSVRCRQLIERALDRGLRGLLAFTLPEALWLAEQGHDDVVVAYPTVDRQALRALAGGPWTERITVMVDSEDHLALIEECGADPRRPVRVAIDVDAGWWLLGGRVRIGARRSPLHTPEQAAGLARAVARRRGVRLDGLMSYEAHIAGVGDAVAGRPLRSAAIRAMQRLSARELAQRRAAVVRAVAAVAPLRFVNGGGTGSVQRTAAEASVTEVAAGSGLFGPALFDGYRAFSPQPAAFFALSVARRPDAGTATALGGGYVASGAAGRDRLPVPALPPGLRLDAREGAGEVQTPLLGPAAGRLRVGDRVWFRHAKAGELCERFEELHLVRGKDVVATVPTYRGDGRCFL